LQTALKKQGDIAEQYFIMILFIKYRLIIFDKALTYLNILNTF